MWGLSLGGVGGGRRLIFVGFFVDNPPGAYLHGCFFERVLIRGRGLNHMSSNVFFKCCISIRYFLEELGVIRGGLICSEINFHGGLSRVGSYSRKYV